MKLKMAMIGGGQGSFIGPVHRMAASLDSMIELVAGSFSHDPEVSRLSGEMLGLDPDRIYNTWEDMIRVESKLAELSKPDLICIVTPNYLHYKPALESVKAGFHIICDKPLCMNIDEALTLEKAIKEYNSIFCITHNYTGYPMVKKARELAITGKLGNIRKVAVEYFQGWLTDKEEEKGNKQAEWRADPSRAGKAGCMADIGTHAFQLSEYITGSRINRLFAQLNKTVDGRSLDDDGNVIISFENGIHGSLLASQVALGEENNLRIRVYGDLGSITWEQMLPNDLLVRWKDRPYQVFRTATDYSQIGEIVESHSRIPAGHPEGFIEAFANLYRNFAIRISDMKEGRNEQLTYDFPGIEDGVRGMRFLDAVVRSSAEEKWINL